MHHRPVLTSATGQAVLPVPCLPKGACGTLGKRPLPRPPASQAGIPHTAGKDSGTRAVAQLMRAKIASTEPGPRKQSFRLRSARGWIYRPAGCPRVKSLCLAPRSCGLPPGHSLEPSAPFAVVRPVRLLRTVRSSKDIRGRQSLRTSASRSAPHDHRGALRIGTGQAQNIPTRMKVNNFRK